MKQSIKKLRSCVHSKPLIAGGLFASEMHLTNKLICDHPEKKIGWTLDVCTGCIVYVNRNKPPEPEPTLPAPKKTRRRKTKAPQLDKSGNGH